MLRRSHLPSVPRPLTAGIAALLITASSAVAGAAPPAAPAPRPYAEAPRRLEYAAPPPHVPLYFYLPDTGSLDAARRKKGDWYGWQTLLVIAGTSAVGIASGIAGGAAHSDAATLFGFGVGAAGLAFGGPIIHWTHGNGSKGLTALGLNFGLPLVGAGLGVGSACTFGACGSRSQGFGVLFGLMIGGSVGLLTSLAVDVSVLSREDTRSGPVLGSRRAPGWTILPDLTLSRDKTTFGFAGVF